MCVCVCVCNHLLNVIFKNDTKAVLWVLAASRDIFLFLFPLFFLIKKRKRKKKENLRGETNFHLIAYFAPPPLYSLPHIPVSPE